MSKGGHLPRNLSKYYAPMLAPQEYFEVRERMGNPLDEARKEQYTAGYGLENYKVIGASPLGIREQVAIERAAYNNVYYAQPPENTASAISDRTNFKLDMGEFNLPSQEIKSSERNSLVYRTITSLMAESMQREIRNAIQNELYSDKNLMNHLPIGIAASPISVNVNYQPNSREGFLTVQVHGPFWLRFYFSGRRAFTIFGDPNNPVSHGMLVFTDPHTGMKIVTRRVHMPAIPKGEYVEKALRKVLANFISSERVERMLSRYVRQQYGNRENYTSRISRDELYRDWDRFLPILVTQLRSLRTPQGIAFYDLIANNRGRRIDKEKMINEFLQKETQAKERFNQAARIYSEQGESNQETRQAKLEVYAALRELIANTKTVLTLSDIKASLPVNLQSKSTYKSIYSKYRAKL